MASLKQRFKGFVTIYCRYKYRRVISATTGYRYSHVRIERVMTMCDSEITLTGLWEPSSLSKGQVTQIDFSHRFCLFVTDDIPISRCRQCVVSIAIYHQLFRNIAGIHVTLYLN